MGKIKFIVWITEFLAVIIITLILGSMGFSKLWIIIPIILVIFSKFFEYKSDIKEKHLRVEAQLRLFTKLCPFRRELDVRCAYHVPRWRGIYQTCSYIPDGGGAGRSFPKHKGIIGKALREKEVLVENFGNDREYREQMISKYNYSPNELQRRKADRRSYLCYPILDENHIILGLIYFDAIQEDTFTLDEDNVKMKEILKTCEQIKSSLL